MAQRSPNNRSEAHRIAELPAPEKGNKLYPGWGVSGLAARVTAAGSRSWVLRYRNAHGVDRLLTIGDCADWPASKARDYAKDLRAEIDKGADPVQERQDKRGAPTVNSLADRFEVDHVPELRQKSQDEYRDILKRFIRPNLGSKQVALVTQADVKALHHEIKEAHPYQANRVLAVLSKMMTVAIEAKDRADNPCKGVKRAPEHRRERFLSPAEIARLGDALAAHPEKASVRAIRLLLLSGARRGEVLGATWEQFDLEGSVWNKPHSNTKQKKDHRLVLSAPAVQLLSEMKEEAKPAERHLFPSRTGEGALTEIKRTWRTVCIKAGLGTWREQKDAAGHPIMKDGEPVKVFEPNTRLHDLRHSFASILASNGASLVLIGSLLGHTQAKTTLRYSHLLDSAQRAAAELVGSVVTGAKATEKPAGEVLGMDGRRRA